MRPSELGEWMGFWSINPWGERRADLRAGVVASTIANVNRDPKKRPSAYVPDDFVVYREPQEPRELSRTQNRDLSKRLLVAFGLKPKRK